MLASISSALHLEDHREARGAVSGVEHHQVIGVELGRGEHGEICRDHTRRGTSRQLGEVLRQELADQLAVLAEQIDDELVQERGHERVHEQAVFRSQALEITCARGRNRPAAGHRGALSQKRHLPQKAGACLKTGDRRLIHLRSDTGAMPSNSAAPEMLPAARSATKRIVAFSTS